MPVHNHIHIVVGGVLYTAFYNIFQILFITARTVSAVFVGIHGKPHYIDIPLFPKLFEGILIHVSGKPCKAMGTDALKLYRVSVFIHKLRSVHRQCTTYRGRGQIKICQCFLITFRFFGFLLLRFGLFLIPDILLCFRLCGFRLCSLLFRSFRFCRLGLRTFLSLRHSTFPCICARLLHLITGQNKKYYSRNTKNSSHNA